MLDPELKAEFAKIHKKFDHVDKQFGQVNKQFDQVNKQLIVMKENFDELGASTARGFEYHGKELRAEMKSGFKKVDFRIKKLDTKLENQINALMHGKADRTELAPIYAQLRNLRTT